MRAEAAALSLGAALVVGAEFVVVGLLPAIAADLGLAPAQGGWLIASFALSSALMGPLLVVLTTRFRPGAMLASSLLAFAASLLLLLFPSFALAIGLRVLQGAALPLFMSLAAAQLAGALGTGRGVAILYVGVTLGGTLAPPLGAFLALRYGWEVPTAALGGLALMLAPACLLLGKRAPQDEPGAAWRLLASPHMRMHLLLSALLFAAMFSSFSYVTLLLGRAGLAPGTVPLALFGFGAAGLAGNWLAGVTGRRAVSATHGVALVVAGATAWLALAPPSGVALIALVLLLWGGAHAAGFVFCQVRVMEAAPQAKSFAGALNISAANIGIALGSLAGSLAIAFGGIDALAPATILFALAAAGAAGWIARGNRLRRPFDIRREGAPSATSPCRCSP